MITLLISKYFPHDLILISIADVHDRVPWPPLPENLRHSLPVFPWVHHSACCVYSHLSFVRRWCRLLLLIIIDLLCSRDWCTRCSTTDTLRERPRAARDSGLFLARIVVVVCGTWGKAWFLKVSREQYRLVLIDWLAHYGVETSLLIFRVHYCLHLLVRIGTLRMVLSIPVLAL